MDINTVTFDALNAPSNGHIKIVVSLLETYSAEETVEIGKNILQSWGLSPSNFSLDCIGFSY